jgi:endonuclease VIII
VPEGPEIRIAADGVANVLQGKTLSAVHFGLGGLQRFEERITGRTVTAVDTRGKAMLTRFDNGLVLYSHNQLYGRWYTTRRPDMPDTSRSLRVALHTKTHSALLYSASEIDVLTDSELAAHPFLQKLGPDILDPMLTPALVAARLLSKRFKNRGFASLYLDQQFLAGIGNYLRSEILWVARVDPAGKPSELRARDLESLAEATLQISRRSYRTRGVTLDPAKVAELKQLGRSYGRYRFSVFGRDGLDCYRCGESIQRLVAAARNIFVCKACQLR